jgi:myosin-5
VEEFLDRFGLLATDKEALFRPGDEPAVIGGIMALAKLEQWQLGTTQNPKPILKPKP